MTKNIKREEKTKDLFVFKKNLKWNTRINHAPTRYLLYRRINIIDRFL